MTAQQLAGLSDGNLPQKLFDTRRLIEELHHSHPLHRGVAADAARRLMALANDRFTFWEGTRAEVWSHIFDGDRLQADIDRGDPRRCPRDPMRAVGAWLVIDALVRVIALRSAMGPLDFDIPMISDEELASVVDGLNKWTRDQECAERDAA